MIREVFEFGLIATVFSFVSFIILSIVGSLLEKKLIGDAKAKAGKVFIGIAFVLFLVMGFSIVPVVVGIFIPLLKQAVPVPIDILEENDMTIVFFFWAVYIIGFMIMLPTMTREGFFTPEKKGQQREDGINKKLSAES